MNTIMGLDVKLEELVVVQKVLVSLPERFNSKVSTIPEMTNLKIITLDQLLVTLTIYEMRTLNANLVTKESIFKAGMKPKEDNTDSCCESDEEEAKFVMKLKRGSNKCKCKCKLPFK